MKIVHTIVVICHQIVFHFQQQNKSNWSDIWSQPNMSGFLQNNVQDPSSLDLDFLELWVHRCRKYFTFWERGEPYRRFLSRFQFSQDQL